MFTQEEETVPMGEQNVKQCLWAELRMGGAASRPGSASRVVIWNGRTLLKPMVKKHARLV